jgi:hypothetical protein
LNGETVQCKRQSKQQSSSSQQLTAEQPAGRHPKADRQYFSVSPTPFFFFSSFFLFLCILGRLGLAAILGFHVGRLLFTIFWKRLFVDKVKHFFFGHFFIQQKNLSDLRVGERQRSEKERGPLMKLFL